MSVVPVIDFDDDSSEEDEEACLDSGTPKAMIGSHTELASAQFLFAFDSIAADPWNEDAWEIVIYESKKGNGGNMSYEDILKLALQRFPTSAKHYKLLTDHYYDKGDYTAFDQLIKEAIAKCKNVDLWISYLKYFHKRNVDLHAHNSELFVSAKKACQDMYEKGIESVGMCVQSSPLWSQYLDFVKSWPENGPLDTGRKLTVLREVYRKAVCNPMENLDVFWKEYEQFEMQTGEHLAVQLLSELLPRHTHAKIVYKERSRLAAAVDFTKLALPPSNDMKGYSYLKCWNALLRYDIANPDNRPEAEYRQYMRIMFDQCLCTCRFYPEIWLSYASFELKKNASHSEAREILLAGIVVLPDVSLLRFNLADIEEKFCTVDIALETLRGAFTAVPSTTTFAVLQRFVRRHFGIIAARHLFTETQPFRNCGVLGIDIFMVHAIMELEVNCDAAVALNILRHAKSTLPVGRYLVEFSKLYARVLSTLRRNDDIRDYFEAVLLGCDENNRGTKSSTDEQLLLWKTYLNCMTSANVCDVEMRLFIVDKVAELSEATFGSISEEPWVLYDFDFGVYTGNSWIHSTLAPQELLFIQRWRQQMQYANESGSARDCGGSNAQHNDEKSKILSTSLPACIRSFLARLPPHSGTTPDATLYIEALRKVVLPPRPVESGSFAVAQKRKLENVSTDDDSTGGEYSYENLFTCRQRLKL